MTQGPSTDTTQDGRSSDAVLESLGQQRARHIQRMAVLMVAGVTMPPTLGLANYGLTALLDTAPPGMDDYWPLLSGGAVGALIGLCLWVAGVGQLIAAARCRRVIAKLSE